MRIFVRVYAQLNEGFQYLSPERARGHYHDTRKSDVWSLGITFFEILVGRTPFEHVEGEQFSTKEDLEKYWSRTVSQIVQTFIKGTQLCQVRGKWVGSYKMSRAVEKLIRRMVAPNADVRCFASDALDDPYWMPKEALKAVQRAAHRKSLHPTISHASPTSLFARTGKSASFSQAALSAINIDVDASRLLDIVSPFTTRTLKERKSNNKENLTKAVSPASIKKSDAKSDFVMVESSETSRKATVNAPGQSSATPSSKNKHVRSQSQPKAAAKSGLLFHFCFLYIPQSFVVLNTPEPLTNKSVVKTPVFVPLEPIKGSTTPEQVVNQSATLPSRTAKSPLTTSNTVKVRSTSGKENANPKAPRVPKSKTLNENSLVRTPSEGRLKKPVGPRKPPPALTADKKKAARSENVISPKKPPTTITRGPGRVLADLSNTKADHNVLGTTPRSYNVQSAFTSPDQITSFFTSPETTDLSMNLNIHGDSYAAESVWLNRTTETAGKNQNENSFASLGKGSVKERWMDWERERERLREMDKDKIRETDDEDTNRLRRSIMTVVSEPEVNTDIPLETDMDATLEFAPVFRTSEESGGLSDAAGNIIDTGAKVEEKEKEADNILGRRRDSQGSRILQTLLAAEPVTVLSPRIKPGTFRTLRTLRVISYSPSRNRE